MANITVITENLKHPIKAWVDGVVFDDHSKAQITNVANLPFIHKHVAVMPDVHAGRGATVGTVVATHKAIVPSIVGVDIGCGMVAAKTSLRAEDLPTNLKALRSEIERLVPHGYTGRNNDRGVWGTPPEIVDNYWAAIVDQYKKIVSKHGKISHKEPQNQLGTLGTGNHFIEICLDQDDFVWIMLHSGSRGPGNRIGQHFIELAKKDMEKYFINLPDMDLSYIPEGSEHFDDYVEAVLWAQEYASMNRELMLKAVIYALKHQKGIPNFEIIDDAINCHHNYISKEHHFHQDVWVTRKGAVRARKSDKVIIPGSMGAKSYIAVGKGNPESFHSCSHGAGRAMSRTEATKRFTKKDVEESTAGVECKKDSSVIDEIPMAYKDIDAVINAQEDLIEVLFTLKQILCVKG